jgi:hypothetical protein
MLFGSQIKIFLHCSEKYVTECEAGGEAKINETIDNPRAILEPKPWLHCEYPFADLHLISGYRFWIIRLEKDTLMLSTVL